MVDASEGNGAGQALRESEANRRLVLENIDEVVYMVKLTPEGPFYGTVQLISPRVKEILGYTPEEFQSDSSLWFGLVHPDDRSVLKKTTLKILEKRETGVREYRLRHKKTGEYLWVEDKCVPQLDDSGKVVGLFGVARDVTDRKGSEEVLKESEERFRRVFEDGPHGMLIVGLDYRPIRANKKVCEILGYNEEELKTIPFPKFTHPEDLEWELPIAKKLITGEIPAVTIEKRFVRKDNQIIWASVTASMVRDRNGRPINGIVIIEDITERKQAEDQLQHRLTFEAAVARASRVFITPEGADLDKVLKVLGEAVSANRAYIFRLRENGSLTDNLHEWCAPGTQPQIDNLQDIQTSLFGWWMRELKQDHNLMIGDVEALPPEAGAEKELLQAQDIKSLLVVPIYSPSGDLVGFMGFDDTEKCREWSEEDAGLLRVVAEMVGNYWARQQAQAALGESEAQFRALFQTSPDGVGIDREGDLLYANPAFLKMHGLENMEECRGRSIANFVAPADRERVQAYTAAREAGEPAPTTYEVTGLRSDGTEFPKEVTAAPFEYRGQPATMAIMRDITERKQAEKEIRLLQTTTQAITEAKDFDSALEVMLTKVCEATAWTFGEAWVPNAEGTALEASPACYCGGEGLGDFRKLSHQFTFAAGTGLPGRVWSSKQPEWTPDVSAEAESIYLRAQIALDAGLKAALGVPILVNDEVLAVLAFFMHESREEDEALVELVSAVAAQLGSVLQRKRAEADQSRLATAIESAGEGVIITGLEGAIQYVNPAFERITGYAQEEAKGHNPRFLKSGQHDKALYQELWQTITAGRVWKGTLINRRKDGSLYPAEQTIAPIKDPSGLITNFVSVERDITQRRRAEAALKEGLALLEKFFNYAPNAIIVVDEQGRIERVNVQGERKFGYRAEELIGQPVEVLVPEASQLAHRAHRADYLQKPETRPMGEGLELYCRRKDGTHFPVDISLGVLKTGEGLKVLAIIRDLTEHKAMQEKLIQSERLAAIGELAAGVAHEVNTPLANISLLADNLLITTADKEVGRAASKIVQQVDFAAYIVKDLLNYARPLSLDLEIMNLDEILEAALAQLDLPQWVKVQRQFETDLPPFSGDRVHLQEIFTNLIRNAVDAMEAQGGGNLTFKARQLESVVELTLTDTGPGIPDRDLPRLFEPFFSTKPVGKGTGLGLPIVQRIVHAHGGTVNVKSKPGLGTRVIVTLPFKPPEAEGGGLVEED